MEVFLGGIYIIKNNINNKVYIGLSKNLNNRIKQHKNRLLNNIKRTTVCSVLRRNNIKRKN